MFDFEPGKLIVIGAVALVVIGPKELPRVLRHVGQTVAKVRRMAAEFQSQFMDAMREAEIADVKEEMSKIADAAKIDVAFDPVRDIRKEIGGALSDTGASLKDVAEAPAVAGLAGAAGLPAVAELPAPGEAGPASVAAPAPAPTPILAEGVAPGGADPVANAGLVAAGVAPVAVENPEDVNASGSEATMDDVRRALETFEGAKPVKESAA